MHSIEELEVVLRWKLQTSSLYEKKNAVYCYQIPLFVPEKKAKKQKAVNFFFNGKILSLHTNSGNSTTPPLPVCTIDVIWQTVNTQIFLLPPQKKKLLSYGIAKENLNKIYPLPFKATKEVKLAIFQHKIIHNILATNSILYKMKKVASPSCSFCPTDSQNIFVY